MIGRWTFSLDGAALDVPVVTAVVIYNEYHYLQQPALIYNSGYYYSSHYLQELSLSTTALIIYNSSHYLQQLSLYTTDLIIYNRSHDLQ